MIWLLLALVLQLQPTSYSPPPDPDNGYFVQYPQKVEGQGGAG